MKLTEKSPKVIDEVITEVRAIKRSISERHGNDIDRLIDALIIQERSTIVGQAKQNGTGQPAADSEADLEGEDKPKPKSRLRPK